MEPKISKGCLVSCLTVLGIILLGIYIQVACRKSIELRTYISEQVDTPLGPVSATIIGTTYDDRDGFIVTEPYYLLIVLESVPPIAPDVEVVAVRLKNAHGVDIYSENETPTLEPTVSERDIRWRIFGLKLPEEDLNLRVEVNLGAALNSEPLELEYLFNYAVEKSYINTVWGPVLQG